MIERLRGNPALAASWHDEQLRWLSTVPGYRALVRARVSEEAKAREARISRIERHNWRLRPDVDTLGREIDPCG